MKYKFRGIAALLILTAIAGCETATGTVVVTGQQRPAIKPGQVQLYSMPPQSPYEVIAFVRASSANGWTDQQSVDYAVEELQSKRRQSGPMGLFSDNRAHRLAAM